jgi:uncharacterized membrane protein
MTLPELPFKIPEIPLPFDIPALMHPPVAHFIIALPVIILLLEVINLIAKKRAIGVTSFFLLVLTVAAAVAAYLTGSVDGKAAWDILTQDGQTALKAHKLFGTYLLFASAIVVLFKLISVMIQRGLTKAVYLLILIIFVAGILKQGKEGGELVYTHGANVKIVKTMDDEMFDLKDELEDYKAEEKEAEEEAAAEKEAATKEESASTAPATETVEEKSVTEAVKETTEATTEAVEEKAEEVQEKAADIVDSATEKVEEKAEEVKEASEETAAKVEASTEEVVSPAVEVVSDTETPKPEIATH